MTHAADEDQRPAQGKQRAPSLATKLAYGVGAAAFGIKDGGFSFFLLLFYSQVIGLDARLVGLALTIALALDAISDPIVGYWSDNFRSKFGRRHVFMYASAIPIAVSYYLLWRPPAGWDANALFWYLLALAILTRTFITFFETPSAALAPELTHDYDQRSTLLSFRAFFGWTGGNAMTVLMFYLLFPAFVTASIPEGQLNRDAYAVYGLIAAGTILVSILISAIGTHPYTSRITHAAPRRLSVASIIREIFQTLSNRSFLSLFLTATFAFTAAGLVSALSIYFSTYFWGFSAQQIGGITLAIFLSALIGAGLAPVITRALDKKRGAIVVTIAGLVVSPLAVLLRLLGVLSDGRDPITFWTVFAIGQLDVILVVCFQALMASMIADLVEQSQLKTGQRSEGIYFAANTFIQKMVSGVGVMAATLVLALAQFPAGAAPGDVGEAVLQRLGWWYLPALILLRLAMLAALSTYSLSRKMHEENLLRLSRPGPHA